jgi:hypothetical protein
VPFVVTYVSNLVHWVAHILDILYFETPDRSDTGVVTQYYLFSPGMDHCAMREEI